MGRAPARSAGPDVLGRQGRRLLHDYGKRSLASDANPGRLRWRRALAQFRRRDEPASAGADDRPAWTEKAEKTFGASARRLQAHPEALPQMACALDFSLSKPKQVIIAGQNNAADTRVLLRLVHERFLPNKILLLADGAAGQKQLAHWLPFIESVARKQGRATAYICENYVCKLPTADPQVVARLLKAKS